MGALAEMKIPQLHSTEQRQLTQSAFQKQQLHLPANHLPPHHRV